MKYYCLLLISVSVVSAQTFQSMVRQLEHSPVEQRQRFIEQYLKAKHITPIIEQDTLLHFVYYGKADTVFVNGNLQHWIEPAVLEKISCGPNAFFYRTFVVPSDARLDYQLIIDREVKLDPRNPFTTPSGYGRHSEVRMPKFFSSPYLKFRSDIPHGTIDSLAPGLKIPAPLLHYLPASRPVKVYRPPGYEAMMQLPAVYFHDGFEAIHFAFVPTIIDNLIADNKIMPIIAVFIPPVNRWEEHFERRDRFVKYVSDDLVPMIDRAYKTEPAPLKRAMAGISSGAQLSLYAVLSRPDVFQNVGGQSTTITQALTDLTKKQYEMNRIPPQLKIYLDCGRFDIPEYNNASFLELNRQYSDLLSSLRIPHYFKEVNDGHEWANWRERMPEMLIYFFRKQ